MPHDGCDGLHWLLPARDERLGVSPNARLMSDGHECGHEEGRSEPLVSDLADPGRFGDGAARLVVAGIKPGVSGPLTGGHVGGEDIELSEQAHRGALCNATDGD